MSLVSAEIVTAAQPLVGMLWLMVRILAPEVANTDSTRLRTPAKDYTTIYPIASRCGVFAKSDIQPLLNDGAKKSDVAAQSS